MKRFLFLVATASILGFVLSSTGCGNGYNGSSTTTIATTATQRAFLLNQFAGNIRVLDVQKDIALNSAITVAPQPQFMIVLSNKTSLVYGSAANTIESIDNTAQTNSGLIAVLPGLTESMVVTPDNLFAYAAIPSTGTVAIVDITKKTVDTTTIPTIPGVRRLVMTKSGKTVLAFSDNSNSFNFIDTASKTATASPASLDRPYTAVISSDDSKAYVLSCGAECGGTSAGITPVDLTSKALSNTVALPAATAAVADSSNLYIAGTDVTSNVGRLSVVSLSSLAVAPPVPISDGLHTMMALAADSKLYIGAKACTNSAGKCLSIYDIGKQSASVAAGIGDVAALTPIKNRTVVYVIQNGVLQIYDTATDLPQATPTIFVSGKVVDVKEVD